MAESTAGQLTNTCSGQGICSPVHEKLLFGMPRSITTIELSLMIRAFINKFRQNFILDCLKLANLAVV